MSDTKNDSSSEKSTKKAPKASDPTSAAAKQSASSDFSDDFLGAVVTVEDRAFGPMYPVAQWVNGKPAAKGIGGIAYFGGFFISADQQVDPDELIAAGFSSHTLITESGDEVEGYAIEALTCSPIRERRCWMVQADGDRFPVRYSYDEYDEAATAGPTPRGTLHLLVAIPGVTDPVSLSFRGMTTRAVMGMGSDRGLIPQYSSSILGAAKRFARAANKPITYPLCAFRLTIGGKLSDTAKDTPAFDEVGGTKKSLVTLPVWRDRVTGSVTKEHLAALFVGNELLALYQQWHRDANEWVDAWSAKALAALRNRGDVDATLPSNNGVSDATDGVVGPEDVAF